MLKIEKLMSIHSGGQFARICVEMDLDKPLCPFFFVIRGYKLLLEYEGLHSICFNCGRYGHKLDQCSEKKTPEANPVPLQEKGSQIQETSSKSDMEVVPISDGSACAVPTHDGSVSAEGMGDEGYGAWMVVKNHQKKKGQAKANKESKKATKNPKNQDQIQIL